MKRIIKKSTTISESIVNDNGETFIIKRKQIVKNNSELITETITDTELEEWKKLDQIYRQEIAKEMEKYIKKNSTSQTEEKLQTLKLLKEIYKREHNKLPDISNRKLRIAELIKTFEKALEISKELE